MPVTNTTREEMLHDMCHLEHPIETICWHTQLTAVWHLFKMTILLVSMLGEKLLKPLIQIQIIKKAWCIVNLHDDSFQNRKVNLMILVVRVGEETLYIVINSLSFSLHPNINIPWGTHQWVRIHQGIPLTFQDTTTETFFPESLNSEC